MQATESWAGAGNEATSLVMYSLSLLIADSMGSVVTKGLKLGEAMHMCCS